MKLEKIMKAFANSRRLKIVAHLRFKKRESVVEIADSTDISYKGTSRHLCILYQAEIVNREQLANEMMYSLNDKAHPVCREIISRI